jgi:small-conductance mechanosensitive channel
VPDRTGHWLDLLSTVLLGLAAIATAWATFQAAHWRSEQGLAGNRSTAARVQANRVAAVANRRVQIDALVFTHWVDAYAHRDHELTAFYFRRFRPEFRPAVAAWVKTNPLTTAGAPLTPFVMPQYRSAASADADALEAKGARLSARAQAEVQRADRYTLCVVLFATALFFAGISTRIQSVGSRIAVVAMGWTLFLAAFAWMLTFPASLTL